jgi:hypothetical protein
MKYCFQEQNGEVSFFTKNNDHQVHQVTIVICATFS